MNHFAVERTSLAGKVHRELNCLPVETQEYRELMDQRTRQALTAKRETQLLPGLASSHAGNLLAPGTLGAPGNFNNFIVSRPIRTKLAPR